MKSLAIFLFMFGVASLAFGVMGEARAEVDHLAWKQREAAYPTGEEYDSGMDPLAVSTFVAFGFWTLGFLSLICGKLDNLAAGRNQVGRSADQVECRPNRLNGPTPPPKQAR